MKEQLYVTLRITYTHVYMSYVDYFGCLVGWYYEGIMYVCNLINVK